MENPNYVLRFNENVLVPKNPGQSTLKKWIWIVAGILLLASLIFQNNLFADMAWATRILLIVLLIGSLFIGGSVRVPSPMELRFYDDHLIAYRPKRYYSKRTTRMEYNRIPYDGIRDCVYRKSVQRLNFHGIVHADWYDYKKDGSLPDKPTFVKTADSICYFYTSAEPGIDFVAEIEAHSPLKVRLQDH